MQRSRASGRVTGLVVLSVVVAVLAGCTVTEERPVEGYRVASAEATTITVVVGAGHCDQDVAARVVSESAADVVVAASARVVRNGSCEAMLVFHDVDVRLAAPIAGRVVHDVRGVVVPSSSG